MFWAIMSMYVAYNTTLKQLFYCKKKDDEKRWIQAVMKKCKKMK